MLTSIGFKLSYNLKTHIEAMHLLFYWVPYVPRGTLP